MKLGMMLPAKETAQWKLALQTGVTHAVTKAAPELSGLPDPSDYEALKTVKERFDAAGLKLYALEGDQFNMDRIKRGLPGRDEDIEKYQQMLRNMGRLGIPLLCYNFMCGVGWYRSADNLPERGGALTSGFDIRDTEDIPPVITPEQMWDNYRYFIKAVIPAAEQAGVQMGLHPDDPPVPTLLGYSRIFISAEAYRKALAIIDSPCHGITFCQATFRAMGEDVFALMREWRQKIWFLHFRDIEGTATCFRETFHDNGPTDMSEYLNIASQIAPESLIRPDHTPTMEGESNQNLGYAVLGNVFAAGYIKGIADSLHIRLEQG